MTDKAFQFALLGATLLGSVIAIFLGKVFDKGSKNSGVISVCIDEKSEKIDFTHMGFLLQPQGGAIGLDSVYQRSCVIRNIGFETVREFDVVIRTDYGVAFNPATEFADFRFEKEPAGLMVDVSDHAKEATFTEVKYKFQFMNRGDFLKITHVSSRDAKISFFAHHPDTEFKSSANVDLLPTVRQKIGSLVSKGRVAELLSAAAVAATAAAGISLIN